jgi:hypothetical protein
MKRAAVIAALVLVGTLGASVAMADTVAFTPPGGLSQANAPGVPVNLGLVFTANTNFSVDALGFYYQSYVTEPEMVALYDSSGNLLTSTTVTLADPNVDGYLWQSITPVALTSGDTYTVDAFTGNNDWSYGSTAPNTAADVTYSYHDYLYTGSLEFPFVTGGAAGGGGGAYYGPNFEIASAVPEPGSLALLAIAFMLMGCLHYRKMLVRG